MLPLTLRLQVNIDDGFLNLMLQDGTAKDDVRVPEGEMGKQIEDDFEAGKDLLVTIVSAMGEEQVSCVVLVFLLFWGVVSFVLSRFRGCNSRASSCMSEASVALVSGEGALLTQHGRFEFAYEKGS